MRNEVETPEAKTGGHPDPRRVPSGFRLTYIIGTYPVLTTTFIDREIETLRRLGVSVQVISIRRPLRLLSPAQTRMQSGVHYVLPAPIAAVLRNHLSMILSRPVAYLGLFVYLLSRPHPTLRSRLRTLLHFGLGVHITSLLRDRYPTDHIHAHFADRASLVALIASRLLNRPFSLTAHANDIYVNPSLLPEKMAHAKVTVTVSRYNESHLRATSANGQGANIRCIYNGIDLPTYLPQPSTPRELPLLLAVGQLKDKKGLRYLIEACRILRGRGFQFECEIVGDGPLRGSLEAMIERLALRDHVALLGALPQDTVTAKYGDADVFVLPCVIASDGDRDGIPTVILEAMAMGLPVVSTDLSGIPEAVVDGTTGLLVRPEDPTALADALARLLDDSGLRERMGRQGRLRVEEMFDAEANVRTLLQEFVE
jgi:colanic acid/amylovoran biosynthesis glycosyltransferase